MASAGGPEHDAAIADLNGGAADRRGNRRAGNLADGAERDGTGVAPVTEASDINQVRELLFGSYSRDNERRFKTADRRLDELAAALQRLTDRFERDHADAQSRANQQHQELQNRIAEVQRDYQERLREQQRTFDERLNRLQTHVAEMVDGLDRGKVDQQEMAEWLVDLGMRMSRALQPA